MMLPVLSSESCAYHYMQNLAVVLVYIYSCIMTRTTAKSLVSYLRPSTTYSDDSRVLHVMVYKSDDSTGSII